MIINYTESFRLIYDATNAYNAGKAVKERLKVPHVTLMRTLITLYALQMNKLMRTSIKYDDLPLLWTNSEQLADLMHCCPRSIRYYIERLKAANFIQEKIFHGSNSSYQLRLNPTLFQLNIPSGHEIANAQKNTVSTISLQNLPHTDSGYFKKDIKDVDSEKSISLETSGDQIPATRVSSPRPERNGSSSTGDELLGGAGALDSGRPELASASLATLTMMIQNLWNFLHVKWYAGKFKFMSDSQMLHAWNYFYAEFISLPESEWNKLWREHLIRIIQVANYQEKNSVRFIPLPSVMFTGKRLYDRTRQWFLKSKQQQVDFDKWKQDYELAIHGHKVFQTVMRDYLKQPNVFAFRKAEQRLSKLSEPALQEFYKVVLTAYS